MSSPTPPAPKPHRVPDSPSARSAGFWDRAAEKYSNKPLDDPEAYQRKLRHLEARLRPEDRVLEIGCGTGSLALELAPLVREVHAVDISGEMLRIGRRKAEAAGTKNVTFHHSSIEAESGFAPASFDVITAFNILHLVDDIDESLAKIYALLRPGGTFVQSTACVRETWIPIGIVIPIMRLFGKAPHLLHLRRAEVLDATARAGFVDVDEQKVTNKPTTAFVLARKPS